MPVAQSCGPDIHAWRRHSCLRVLATFQSPVRTERKAENPHYTKVEMPLRCTAAGSRLGFDRHVITTSEKGGPERGMKTESETFPVADDSRIKVSLAQLDAFGLASFPRSSIRALSPSKTQKSHLSHISQVAHFKPLTKSIRPSPVYSKRKFFPFRHPPPNEYPMPPISRTYMTRCRNSVG